MDDRQYKRRPGRIWAGLFLLLIGGVLLLDQMGFPFPDWLFRWNILLIALGIFVGFRHGFRNGSWIMLILIGTFFTLQDSYPELHLWHYIWPITIIFVGLLIVLFPGGRNRWMHCRKYPGGSNPVMGGNPTGGNPTGGNPIGGNPTGDNPTGGNPTDSGWRGAYGPYGPNATHGWTRDERRQWRRQHHYSGGFSSAREGYSSEDFIDTTAIFGGVHKKILSKNFKGGDITTLMGGTELDLSQSDFTGTARLDVTQIMGGTKIIVPSTWEVRSNVTALFAGFEDKRQQPAIANPDKLLVLQGVSIFGGIELKNY